MSILIKGMEMPKTCSECEWCRYDMAHPLCNRAYRRTDIKTATEGRADFCPLIELPPHGRLIDIKSVKNGKFTIVEDAYQAWWNGALEAVIENAPTVIEAEGSEE